MLVQYFDATLAMTARRRQAYTTILRGPDELCKAMPMHALMQCSAKRAFANHGACCALDFSKHDRPLKSVITSLL